MPVCDVFGCCFVDLQKAMLLAEFATSKSHVPLLLGSGAVTLTAGFAGGSLEWCGNLPNTPKYSLVQVKIPAIPSTGS